MFSLAVAFGSVCYYHPRNVIVLEAGQYQKRDTSARQSRVIIEFLHNALTFFSIMPAYSEEDLTAAITAFRNSEYTSIRTCAYMFNVPCYTLASRL